MISPSSLTSCLYLAIRLSEEFSRLHRVSTQIWYPDISPYRLANIGTSMFGKPSKKVAHFSSSAPNVLFILLGWFLRWKVGNRTAAVLWGVASRVFLKEHIAFWCSFHLAFSLCVSLVPWRCIHTVVLMQPQLGRNLVLFYLRDYIFVRSRACL